MAHNTLPICDLRRRQPNYWRRVAVNRIREINESRSFQ